MKYDGFYMQHNANQGYHMNQYETAANSQIGLTIHLILYTECKEDSL